MATYTSKARLLSQGKTVCDFCTLMLRLMQIFGTQEPMIPKIGIHFIPSNPVCLYCPARKTNWHLNIPNIFLCSLDMFIQNTYKTWPPNSTFLLVKIYVTQSLIPEGKYGLTQFLMKHLERSGNQKKRPASWVFFFLPAFAVAALWSVLTQQLLCTQNVCTKVLTLWSVLASKSPHTTLTTH